VSSNRPRWAQSAYLWLTDGQYDGLDARVPDDHWRWKVGEVVQRVGVATLCFTLGHYAISDQCGKPEHDLCTFCMKSMPNQAERKPSAGPSQQEGEGG
jgi:hypothetical protein